MRIEKFFRLDIKELESYLTSLSDKGMKALEEEYIAICISSIARSNIWLSRHYSSILNLEGIYWGRKLVKGKFDISKLSFCRPNGGWVSGDDLLIVFYNSANQVIFRIRIDMKRVWIKSLENYVV